ncbi:ATP-dependent RecD-like DNA helicase [Thermoflexales bacterium]|nr:ATP-dependent RecD-like DNA helicase [Thermoflexales bacterium]
MDSLDGLVERITYYNAENGYTVLRLNARGYADLVTVVGTLPEITPGESLRLQGQWINSTQYGKQFKAEKCEQVLPATIEGLKKYLGSGLIKGVGPVTAQRIVKRFGLETLDVLDHSPERIRQVLGIGPKRADAIARAWDEQKSIKQVMLFLQGHGVNTGLAVKIYKQYGDAAIDLVQADPYRLAHDIYGIGFKTADKIAHDLGLPHDAPSRVAAGVVYTLSNFTDQGHVFSPQSVLIHDASELLDVQLEQVTASLDTLQQTDQIKREVIYPIKAEGGRMKAETQSAPASSLIPHPSSLREEPAIYLTPFYQGEVSVARRLNAIIDSRLSRLADLQHIDLQAALNELSSVVSNRPTARLSDQQQHAVRAALTNKVTVLTGGPGTGKTTTMRAVIDLLEKFNHRYALASPTGRAAKRLSQATDRSAKTIHRLLEFAPQEGFKRNVQNPLEIDLLVIDEASMIDLLLMNHLLKAVPLDAHLLLVGDVDQLPSVGAGDVLRDIIASERAAVIRLEVIFRQAMQSHIITNSHRINRGQMPLTPQEAGDFFFFIKEDPDEAAELIVDLVAARIPNKFGVKPADIQVLSPMYRSSTGVTALNTRLQEKLNPPSPKKVERQLAGTLFRVGDRVMQTRNNYDKDTYNGDLGYITGIDLENQTLAVQIDDRPIEYEWSEADELALAYAVSVHKAQGSEYPAIVLPIFTQHYLMLQRNLLYTAITRARQLVVLVGTRRALAMAVKNNKQSERYSGLKERLVNVVAP